MQTCCRWETIPFFSQLKRNTEQHSDQAKKTNAVQQFKIYTSTFMQAFVQVVINDAEHKEEPPRPLSVTVGTTGTI